MARLPFSLKVNSLHSHQNGVGKAFVPSQMSSSWGSKYWFKNLPKFVLYQKTMINKARTEEL